MPLSYRPRPFRNAVLTVVCLAAILLLGIAIWRIFIRHPDQPTGKTDFTNSATQPPAPLKWVDPIPLPSSEPPAVVPPTTSSVALPQPPIPTPLTPAAVPPSHSFVAPPPVSPIPDSWLIEVPPVTNILLAQIALSTRGISSGSIDGIGGNQTAEALRAFQMDHGLEKSGLLDEPTLQLLTLKAPPFRRHTLLVDELARLRPVPEGWVDKSAAKRLEYGTALEFVGELAHASPQAVARWNPNVTWDHPSAGDSVLIPSTEYPPPRKASLVRISLQGHWLRAFDSNGVLLTHFPCSIGHIAEKRPTGELHVVSVAKEPNYTFNPSVFPESPEAQAVGRKLIIPPGPNNPVGVAWIGLDRPGYGIHGTPSPEQVGRTESHGCFRLANWNADYLRQMVRPGTPVWIEP